MGVWRPPASHVLWQVLKQGRDWARAWGGLSVSRRLWDPEVRSRDAPGAWDQGKGQKHQLQTETPGQTKVNVFLTVSPSVDPELAQDKDHWDSTYLHVSLVFPSRRGGSILKHIITMFLIVTLVRYLQKHNIVLMWIYFLLRSSLALFLIVRDIFNSGDVYLCI